MTKQVFRGFLLDFHLSVDPANSQVAFDSPIYAGLVHIERGEEAIGL